jgi:predicted transcriptional regulator
MQSIKISSKVDEDTWNELKALASETHQSVSCLLTEAIHDYVRRKRVRPEVLNQLEK